MKRAAGVLAATLLVTVPASAQAATLTLGPAKRCYRSGESVLMAGSGFTAGAPASVSLDGQSLGSLTPDAAGNFGSPLRFGAFRGVGQHSLTATDSANPANVGAVSFLGAAVTVRVTPAQGRPGRRLRVRSTGFTTGRRLWAHILRRGFRRNVRIGRLRGPCHRGNTRRRIFKRNAATGAYTVQFDTRRRYSRRTSVRVRFRVTVFRRAGGASAASPTWRRIG
jgi:hypothetical protein